MKKYTKLDYLTFIVIACIAMYAISVYPKTALVIAFIGAVIVYQTSPKKAKTEKK